MYVNDFNEYVNFNGFKGKDIGTLKLFLLLYTDQIVIIADIKLHVKVKLNC